MILSLKRNAAGLSWIAVCSLLVALLAPFAADAQNASTAKRAAPPSTARSSAKSVLRSPSPWVANPAVYSKDSYLIVDAMSGSELAADRPDELRHPASLTKMMTLYLTFSALDSGRLSLGDALPVSANALNAPPTKMGMQSAAVNVRDAIMGIVTRSANDAAILLAEVMGGDEESFAQQMTLKARQIGMASTVFRNASGLPSSEQVTTARDMATLAHALLRDFPHYYPVFSIQSYSFHGRYLQNHNHMLASYAGADGLKTGYTVASGYNLVMSAMRDNRRLIGVVMGGDSAFQRDRLMADLMDRGFAGAQALGLAPWTSQRRPPSARYTATNFVSGTGITEAPRAPLFAKVEPPAAPMAPGPADQTRVASFAAALPADPSIPVVGSWVIQVGSFGDSQAAQLALERASSVLPDALLSHAAATVDEVQVAQKTFHRARLTNLSQEDAVGGCKRLELRKIFCAALQVTAWNTPGAR